MTESDAPAAPERPLERPKTAPPVPPHPLYQPESDEVVWHGRFPLQRVRFRYRRRDGTLSGPLTWELARRGEATMILPWDPVSDRIALIEQFRLPALAAGEEPRMIELPAGLVEPGESVPETARRELEEEAGLSSSRMEQIGTFMLHQGYADERVHFHLACVSLEGGPAATGGLASEEEETAVLVVDAAEAFAMVAENRIRNAPTALALLWLQVNHARLRDEWTR
ncbi:NUDIX domain-containing protein [Roseomonas populi]|uniref:ADP-ribose pyrophosphatase n=1 Tax=Roseomonas populi TaxID=3121582 RepID=A0ABT1X1V3_9PROT|nr:NUDIX domain-containing protein [Roseomonas pecuniae]MCR0982079.1 NUDIX domain-containing protein [Roseomonas pecuniae]